jgi:hypothetical protein
VGAAVAKRDFAVETEVSETERVVMAALAARGQKGLDCLAIKIKRSLRAG